MIEGYIERTNNKEKELIKLAYYTEAFARQKKLPKLETLLRDKPKKKKTKKDSDLIEIAKRKGLEVPKGGELVGGSR